MSCGVGHRSSLDLALLWLWHRLVATAPIRSLAWEHPYATGSSPRKGKKAKRQKKKKKKEINAQNVTSLSHRAVCLPPVPLGADPTVRKNEMTLY